jgi:hypothetical protein
MRQRAASSREVSPVSTQFQRQFSVEWGGSILKAVHFVAN